MKTITLLKQQDGSFKMETGEMTPLLPTQQVTVAHSLSDARHWMYHVQLSNDWLYIKRARTGAVAIHLDEIVQLALLAEPALAAPSSDK